jgi:hypothetical protein
MIYYSSSDDVKSYFLEESVFRQTPVLSFACWFTISMSASQAVSQSSSEGIWWNRFLEDDGYWSGNGCF